MPNTQEEWGLISEKFERRWNCIGAWAENTLKLKHPRTQGQCISITKKINSVFLMALADAEFKFTFIDIGSLGRDFDGRVFSRYIKIN